MENDNTERYLVQSNIRQKEWMSIVQKAKYHDPADGMTAKHICEARAPRNARPEECEVLYWGRDGWKEGFVHAIFYVEKTTNDNDVYNLYIKREDDPKADSLTASFKKTKSWIQNAIDNAEDKDRQDIDHPNRE